jgi:hypothetical protein
MDIKVQKYKNIFKITKKVNLMNTVLVKILKNNTFKQMIYKISLKSTELMEIIVN